MKPLYTIVVAILVITANALPENIEDVKELPQSNEPVLEAEASSPQARTERCTACSGTHSLKSPKEFLAALKNSPNAEVHTQESFEGCSSEKGCAGLKVKDGKVIEKFGNLQAFQAAANADTGNEFQFQAAGNSVFEGGAPNGGPFWWMNQNSPFKAGAAGSGGAFEKFSKSSSSFTSTSNGGAGGVDLGANPFLNGDFSKLAGGAGFNGAGAAGGSNFASQTFESSAKEIDITKNPFLNGGVSAAGAGFGGQSAFGSGSQSAFGSSSQTGFGAQGAQSGFGAQGGLNAFGSAQGSQTGFAAQGNKAQSGFGAQGSQSGFGSAQGSQSGFNAFNANKFSSGSGYTGSSPAPFAPAGGANVNLIQNSQKSEYDFEQQQQTQQNIDEAFQSTGNVNAHDNSGGDLQQTCAGQGYVCVHKSQCNNGVVNTNGGGLLQANTQKQYCNTRTEICCRIETASLAGNNNLQGSLGVGSGTFQGSNTQGQGLFSQSGSSQGSQSSFGASGFGAGQATNTQTGFNANANRGSATTGFGTQFGAGSAFNSNKFGSTASGFGSTVAPTPGRFGANAGSFNNEVFKATSQTNFVETDSFSAGSENAGVFRPGAIGSALKPGVPYLPPLDTSTSGSNVISTAYTPAFVTTPRPFTTPRPVTTPRPFSTPKPTYLPPVSTKAPEYLPPIDGITGSDSFQNPHYVDGQLILDETLPAPPRPPVRPPPPQNTDIPAGCAAALKCTPIEFCTAEGVISNTTVALTRDQEAYRVPLTDCKDLETGRIGKCCRDPFYTDPWPVNQLGKWVPGVFGGNDGKYVPDSRGSSNNQPGVTVRPPVTGSVILNNFRTTTKPLQPQGPNQVTGGFPSPTTPTPGSFVQKQFGQGSYSQGGRGSIQTGGQGQVAIQGQGQYGAAGQGNQGSGGQFAQGSSYSQTQQGFGQNNGGGQAVIQGQGSYGQSGVGTQVTQGAGFGLTQGGGQVVRQGQGVSVSRGQGFGVVQGGGVGVSRGSGFAVTGGQGQYGSQGQGSLVSRGQGQTVTQGGGFGVSQGSGFGVQQGGGFGVSQGSGFGVQQGGGFGIQQGGGQAVIRGQGQTVFQGQGQKLIQGQGAEVSQGVVSGVRQGQGFSVSQNGGYGVENEFGESIQRVYLPRYTGSGECGVKNPQKPYGNRRDLEVDFAEIPWQAMILLKTNKSLLCGGVITRPDVVITSASCVEGFETKNILIKGGEWKLGIDEEPLPFQIVQVKTILRHPQYKPGTYINDVAILVLAENLRLAKNIWPICLPSSTDTLDAFYNGAGECVVTGWGKSVLQAHLLGSIMHSLNVSLLNPGECQFKITQDYPNLLKHYEQDSCVCGQPTNPANNICKVDIGSALACTTGDGHYTLRGIYSWDSGCQTGNQLASFFKFDLEWYEWSIGLIESVRFSQYTTTKNKIIQQGGGFGVQQGGGFGVQQGGGFGIQQGGGQAVIRGQGQTVFQGQGQKLIQGQGGEISQGVVSGVRQGQGFSVSQNGGYGVENEFGESIQRVYLPRYTESGQCGVSNPQIPYGNRRDLEVDFAEIPWQAMILLKTNKSLLCGGVITRPDVVITSASCVEGFETKNILIKGGEWKLGIDEEPLPFQIVQVKTILRHPQYKPGTYINDVAILVLAENLRLAKNIWPICLPSSTDTLDAFYNGAGECVVTGWGKSVLQAHLLGSIMHSLNVSLLNPGECQFKITQDYPNLLKHYEQDSCVCGQPTNPANNICKVDIGSALACTTGDGHYTLRGIYSWDSGCQTGNQLASFFKFDLEWYEWSIGLIESVRFSQYTTTKNKIISQSITQGGGQGQGSLVSRGQGQTVTQGGGFGVQQGSRFGVQQGGGFGVQQGGGFGVQQGGGFGIQQGGGQAVIRGQGQTVFQGQGQKLIQGQGGEISQGVVSGVRQGQGFSVSQNGGYGVENEFGESIQRVYLPRYTESGQCGVSNPQIPYGNRRDLEVDFAEIPWQAMILLKTNKSLLCGGVITRPDVVITSASCVEGFETKNILIKGGEWKLGTEEEPLPNQIVKVKTILRHPQYKPGTYVNDVAILVLTENLRLAKNIWPICLPSSTDTLDAFYYGAGECRVTGWGKSVLRAQLPGSIMHSLNVSLLNPGECQSKITQDYPHLLERYEQDSCVCGQPTNPANDICKVDTGSALACTTGDGHYTLRGIYSWESSCQTGNQLASFYKFDLEWYEWSIGLIESVRFSQYTTTKNTKNKVISQVSGVKGTFGSGIKGSYGVGIKGSSGGGVKGSVSSGATAISGSGVGVIKGFGVQGQSGQYQFGSGSTGSGIKGSVSSGSGAITGSGALGIKGFGLEGQSQSGEYSQFGVGKFGTGSTKFSESGEFGSEIKGPVSNTFSATYTEKKFFQTEPKIVTYTTKPEIVTFTTKPEYFTYTTKPKYVTYTTKPEIITYTTKPEIITYTTKPKIVTYTTKPQIIRYDYQTSGSQTNQQIVAPSVSFNPSFSEVVGAKHSHDGNCKCLEGKK